MQRSTLTTLHNSLCIVRERLRTVVAHTASRAVSRSCGVLLVALGEAVHIIAAETKVGHRKIGHIYMPRRTAGRGSRHCNMVRETRASNCPRPARAAAVSATDVCARAHFRRCGDSEAKRRFCSAAVEHAGNLLSDVYVVLRVSTATVGRKSHSGETKTISRNSIFLIGITSPSDILDPLLFGSKCCTGVTRSLLITIGPDPDRISR